MVVIGGLRGERGLQHIDQASIVASLLRLTGPVGIDDTVLCCLEMRHPQRHRPCLERTKRIMPINEWLIPT